MDLTTLSLCMDSHLPIHVFAREEGTLRRVVSGERVGTLITSEKEAIFMTVDELIQDAHSAGWTAPSCPQQFNTVRTGRASAALLDRILDRLLRTADAAEARDDQRVRSRAC